MSVSELDNPFWSSLQSRHRGMALCNGDAARYPADVAPFLGVCDAGADVDDALRELVDPGESVYLLGVAPRVPDGFELIAHPALAQMIRVSACVVADGPAAITLTAEHQADVLALTALVYPHYFRQRTMELGRYIGIYEGDSLAAMAGERLGTDGFQEISAICSHPEFTGRGYARRLTALLVNETLERGRIPFLHVSHANTRAKQLYSQMGFQLRRDIGFWSLRRGA